MQPFQEMIRYFSFVNLRHTAAIAGENDAAAVGRNGRVRVRMLGRVDLDGPVFVGEGPAPMRALIAGARAARRDRRAEPSSGLKS